MPKVLQQSSTATTSEIQTSDSSTNSNMTVQSNSAGSEIIISSSTLSNLRYVSRGSYGLVYRALWNHTSVAVKDLPDNLGTNPESIAEFKKEITVLAGLRHPNIVLYLGTVREQSRRTGLTRWRLVTEWISQGSLYHCLQRCSDRLRFSWDKRLRMAMGVAAGMLYLHSQSPNPIAHLDLKSPNVLVTRSFECKVADFGLSHEGLRSTAGKGGSSNSQNSGSGTSSGGAPLGTYEWRSPDR